MGLLFEEDGEWPSARLPGVRWMIQSSGNQKAHWGRENELRLLYFYTRASEMKKAKARDLDSPSALLAASPVLESCRRRFQQHSHREKASSATCPHTFHPHPCCTAWDGFSFPGALFVHFNMISHAWKWGKGKARFVVFLAPHAPT